MKSLASHCALQHWKTGDPRVTAAVVPDSPRLLYNRGTITSAQDHDGVGQLKPTRRAGVYLWLKSVSVCVMEKGGSWEVSLGSATLFAAELFFFNVILF